eukprot:1475214-Amphidinium_carterae.1
MKTKTLGVRRVLTWPDSTAKHACKATSSACRADVRPAATKTSAHETFNASSFLARPSLRL